MSLPLLEYFRLGAIQTKNQIAIIEEFGAYLKPLRVVFSSV